MPKNYFKRIGEYMRWLRWSKAATSSFAELEINTPVGRSENLVMALHEFQYEIFHADSLDDDGDIEMVQISTSEEGAEVYLNDKDLLDKVKRTSDTFGTPANNRLRDVILRSKYYPPLISPHQSIYAGVLSTQSLTVYGRIGYTLRYARNEDLYEALV